MPFHCPFDLRLSAMTSEAWEGAVNLLWGEGKQQLPRLSVRDGNFPSVRCGTGVLMGPDIFKLVCAGL